MTKKWDISYGWPLFIFFSKIALFVDNTQTFSRATDLILGDMHYHIMECSESGHGSLALDARAKRHFSKFDM